MKGLQDPQFREYYSELLKLDWTGYDVWAVGGIVSDWETEDIDIIVFGPKDEPRINALFEALRPWPFSPNWCADERALSIDRYSRMTTLITIGLRNPRDPNTLRYIVRKFPMTKTLMRMRKGIYHGEPVQLIQNGVQIYL